MTLFNPDGTPYKLAGTRQQYDPTNPDLELYDLWDQEAIEVGGSPIDYYQCMIQVQTVDELYREDRGKLYNPYPVRLWAYYEPPQQSQGSLMQGMDPIGEEVIFEMNKTATLKALGGQLPKFGSRIFTPHRGENWYVVDRKISEFRQYSTLHIQLICQKFPENITTGEGRVTAQRPDFPLYP